MPRPTRMQAKAPSTTRGGARQTVEPPAHEQLGENYASVYAGWTDFYQEMGSRLTQNLERQQKAYEDLFDRWSRLAGSAQKIWEKNAENGEERELYDVWRNYVNKIGPRMVRAGTEGLKGYNEVVGNLERYATRIADATRDAGTGRLGPGRAEEVYRTWIEVASRFRQQVDRAAGTTREELDDLSCTWMELSDKLEGLLGKDLGEKGAYGQFITLWATEAKEMGETLAGFVRGHDHDHEGLRKAWADHFMKMQQAMDELARSIGTSYEEMYRRWLTGGVTSLSDLPLFPPWWSEAERARVRDLNRRLEEVEKKSRKTG